MDQQYTKDAYIIHPKEVLMYFVFENASGSCQTNFLKGSRNLVKGKQLRTLLHINTFEMLPNNENIR